MGTQVPEVHRTGTPSISLIISRFWIILLILIDLKHVENNFIELLRS